MSPSRWHRPPRSLTRKSSKPAQLNDRLDAIGEDFGGSMGIAGVDVDARWSTGFNERALLPQQSVSKTWVALTALVMAEEGLLNLDAPIRVGREDLTLFHQPMRKEILRQGAVSTDAAELIERAIQQSDNTANNALLQRVGGPRADRAMLLNQGLTEYALAPAKSRCKARLRDWNGAMNTRSRTTFMMRATLCPITSANVRSKAIWQTL